MAPQVSPLGIGFPATIALISFALLLYLFYRWLLPKPIPGIPYNKASAKSLLGDIPAFLNAEKQTQEIFPWMRDQFHVHKSPIVQVFCQPFGKPWVLVGDFVEAEDILIRRNHEFSRSPQLASYFSGTTPNHHIVMPSNDEFKQHRQLIQDMITPNFLHQITAPQIYERFSSLMDFWKEKSRLAQGHAFSIKQDIYNAGMDTVWTAAFGFESAVNATKAQVELLASLPSVEVSSDAGTPVVFPVAPYPREYTAITELIDTIEIALKSPLPKFAHWCVRQTGKYRRNYKIKEDLIKSEIEKRAVVLNGTEKKDFSVRCGLDDMLRRELISAERHGRRPDFHTRTMYDEAMGYVVAGSETTSTALSWSMKFLTAHPDVQRKLRSAVRDAFPNAVAEKRPPSAQEITKAVIPYLDATQEELLRHSLTEVGSIRRALTDVQVLGQHIPEGIDVWFLGNGPSFFQPAFDIPASLRSPSALAAKSKIGAWDPKDIAKFKPERWLVTDDDGGIKFNPSAGPMLIFSLGPRGCWGRRMAYLEMRIVLTLIIWNFELLDVPGELGGWEAVDKIAHQPQKCYVRLAKAEI